MLSSITYRPTYSHYCLGANTQFAGKTDLHKAVEQKNSDLVKDVLDTWRTTLSPNGFKKSLNEQDYSGFTALHSAALEGYTEIANLLLSQPEIDVELQDRDYEPAAEVAKYSNQFIEAAIKKTKKLAAERQHSNFTKSFNPFSSFNA